MNAVLEIERAPSQDGPYSLVFAGPQATNVITDPAPNGTVTCYRMRVLLNGATSDWSAPACVTPAEDAVRPTLSLRPASGSFTTQSHFVQISITAGSSLDERNIDPGLKCPDTPPAATEVLVSSHSEFIGAEWQPFAPEVSASIGTSDPRTVYVSVRDAAGNESRIESLAFIPEPTVVTASRLYSPSQWFDGVATLPQPIAVLLPAEIEVLEGNAGNHKAYLTYQHGGDQPIKCTYRGGSDDAHPTTPEEITKGLRYVFDTCHGGGQPGDVIVADLFSLHVHSGDHEHPADKTTARMVLSP